MADAVAASGYVKHASPPRWRILTAPLRRRPDFVIIGTQRGGTTSLYRYLTAHPKIGAALRKEVHYLDHNYDQGPSWYLAHFPLRGRVPVVGEASPYYLFHPDVPRRARAIIPSAKFIAVLRNPVDRAYSHYQMKVRRNLETLSFEEAITREDERLAGIADRSNPAWRHFSYLHRGLYEEQLQRWMSVFPRDQFLIVKSEEFYAEPERILHETLAVLGLEPGTPPALKVYNLAEYSDMDGGTRQRLLDYYAPHNHRLYDLLGRDLGWEHE